LQLFLVDQVVEEKELPLGERHGHLPSYFGRRWLNRPTLGWGRGRLFIPRWLSKRLSGAAALAVARTAAPGGDPCRTWIPLSPRYGVAPVPCQPRTRP